MRVDGEGGGASGRGSIRQGERLQSPPGLAQNELRADGGGRQSRNGNELRADGGCRQSRDGNELRTDGVSDCEISLIGGDK